MKITDKITITNEDNMELMSRYPDKYFDLAIVDPPYGINIDSMFDGGKNSLNRIKKFNQINWDDNIPNESYFIELKRVSKNQIIWGGNYFANKLSNTKCWVCWDKLTMIPSMSRIELAYTTFAIHSQYVKINSNQKNRIHITQKPIDLYKWLLNKFGKKYDKILDTHLGSGSIAIACYDYDFDLTGCEIDKEYYDLSIKRIKNHIKQTKLF